MRVPIGGRPRIRVKTTQSERFCHVSWASLRFASRHRFQQPEKDAILCLQNEPLHFSEKHQREEMKLHHHIMREKFFSRIVSMHSSSQSSANYLSETRQIYLRNDNYGLKRMIPFHTLFSVISKH